MAEEEQGSKDTGPRTPAEPPRGGEPVNPARFAGIGIQFALSILLGLYGGQWLDRRLGTPPLFLITGVFLGAGAAFYSMYRALMRPPENKS